MAEVPETLKVTPGADPSNPRQRTDQRYLKFAAEFRLGNRTK